MDISDKEKNSIKNHICGKTHKRISGNNYAYSSLKKRLFYRIVDLFFIPGILFGAGISIMFILTEVIKSDSAPFEFIAKSALSLSVLLYFISETYYTWKYGGFYAHVGGFDFTSKKPMSFRVIDSKGNNPSLSQSIIRAILIGIHGNFLIYLLFLMLPEQQRPYIYIWILYVVLDFAMIGITKKKQALHDIIARTYVIDIKDKFFEYLCQDEEGIKKIIEDEKRIDSRLCEYRKEKILKKPRCIYPTLSQRSTAWLMDNLFIGLLTLFTIIFIEKIGIIPLSTLTAKETGKAIVFISVNWLVFLIYESSTVIFMSKKEHIRPEKLPGHPAYKDISNNSMRVVMENKKPMTWNTAIRRAILKSLEGNASFYIFGYSLLKAHGMEILFYIWLIFMISSIISTSRDPKGRAYYDISTGTVVVRKAVTWSEEHAITDKYIQ